MGWRCGAHEGRQRNIKVEFIIPSYNFAGRRSNLKAGREDVKTILMAGIRMYKF
jgi:hypothetical protein